MTVYIFVGSNEHENTDILGVYATRELAERAMAKEKRKIEQDRKRFDADETGEYIPLIGYDWYGVLEHRVRGAKIAGL